MLSDFLRMGQRTADPFGMPQGYSTPGFGDEVAVAGNIPVSQRMPQRAGMFGNSKAFAANQGADVPGAGVGIGQAPISLTQLDVMPDQVNSLPSVQAVPGMQPDKPRFFDKDGGWRDALGAFADGLAGAAGMPATYGPAKARERQHQREQQSLWDRQNAKLAADRNEWLWREQWKQAHPDDQFTQFMVAGGIDPRSPQGQALYKQRAEGMAAPPLMAVDGFDPQGNPTKTFMPRPTFAPAGQPTPSGLAVGTTRNGYRFKGGNPNDRSSWEPVGGASPDGGPTFR